MIRGVCMDIEDLLRKQKGIHVDYLYHKFQNHEIEKPYDTGTKSSLSKSEVQ